MAAPLYSNGYADNVRAIAPEMGRGFGPRPVSPHRFWLKMVRKANLLQDVVGRKAAEQRSGRGDRRPCRAAVGDRARAASGLSCGGRRVHGTKRERRGKHAYRARRPPVLTGLNTQHNRPDELSVGSNRTKCARRHGGLRRK